MTHPTRVSFRLLPTVLFTLWSLLSPIAEAAPNTLDPMANAALTRITANPKTRAWYQSGLENHKKWATLVDAVLSDAGLPAWLSAVPLVESGYLNLGAPEDLTHGVASSRAPGGPGRGLWMFIPETARTYGLVVEAGNDQRYDVTLETAAAIELLTDLHGQFGDWDLALAAYNQGPRVVEAAIAHGGTRNVATLVESGLLNGYVPEVHAAAAILAQPSLVE